MKSVYSALVLALLIALSASNMFAQNAIHMTLSNGGQVDTASIGVDSLATKGEDRALGESDQPPAPPAGSIFFVISEAAGINLKWDLHPGSRSASTKDTFKLKLQLADETQPTASLTWSAAKVRSLLKPGTTAMLSGSGISPTNMAVDSNVTWDPSIDGAANLTWKVILEWNQLLGVYEQTSPIPSAFALNQNYPNPFNPTTVIPFAIQQSGMTEVVVYNILGQKIATLVSEQLNPGTYNAKWSGTDDRGLSVSTGVYYVRMNTTYGNGENFTQMRKMLLMK